MLPPIGFTLCFLTRGSQVLLLYRNKPPNENKWNGVGGHIEPGEDPEASCRREIFEETGLQVDRLLFHGLLTWEGFDHPATGGLYLFSAAAPNGDFLACSEGKLAWHEQSWACSAADVVSNLHIVLPHVFGQAGPQQYHFVYRNSQMVSHAILPLPEAAGLN